MECKSVKGEEIIMLGRAYVQKGATHGWVVADNVYFTPKDISKVQLTDDVEKAYVFDVDNRDGFVFLNAMIEDGYSVVIGSNIVNKKQVMPSAAPFTPEF